MKTRAIMMFIKGAALLLAFLVPIAPASGQAVREPYNFFREYIRLTDAQIEDGNVVVKVLP